MNGLAVAALVAALALAPCAARADDAQEDANKKVVLAFYEAALNHRDFETASQYLGAQYKQHNPNVADGPEGLKALLGFLKTNFPSMRAEIKRVLADGDYVMLHVHSVREPGTRGRAIVDIFRLENGKIVEHWDVIQDVPEKAANPNGMF